MMPEASPKLTAWLAVMLLAPWPGLAATGASSGSVPRALRRELDRDETLLRAQLMGLPDDSGVAVQREPTRLVLRIPAQLLFVPDASTLRADASSAVPLTATLQLLKQRRRLAARISVYSDSIGGLAVNQMLTAQRAHTVVDLLSRQGIGPARLSESGVGERQAIAANDTPETRQQNRRVEIAFETEAGRGVAPAAIKPAPATAP